MRRLPLPEAHLRAHRKLYRPQPAVLTDRRDFELRKPRSRPECGHRALRAAADTCSSDANTEFFIAMTILTPLYCLHNLLGWTTALKSGEFRTA